MDFEEAWREAMQGEGKESLYPSIPQRVHSSDQENGPTASAPDANDPYDEFSDDDLLQSVPFANDAAPAMAPPMFFSTSVTSERPREEAPQTRTVLKASTAPATAPRAVTKTALRRTRTPPSCGVLDFPPVKAPSFMLRGDDGRVRWVTATNHDKSRPPTRRVAAATAPIVVEVDGDDDEGSRPAVTGVIEVGSSSGSENGGVPSDDHDDDLLSSASSDVDELEGNASANFLRGGVNVKDMLRELYAEESKKQAEQKTSKGTAEEGEGGLPGDEATESRWNNDGSAPYDPFLTAQRTPAPRTSLPTSPPPTVRDSSAGSGELWVTKYSPKLFREVLSDETTNLRLLQWLKSWDAYVFPDGAAGNGDSGTAAAASAGAGAGAGGSARLQRSGFPSHNGGTATVKDSVATYGGAAMAAAAPPEERIAVLTGPPGVGKTTLVHVLAAHCGYEVIEVNASVERTASRLEALIKTAVSAAGPAPGGRLRRLPTTGAATSSGMRSGAGDAEGEGTRATTSLVQHLLRPKCLVIDEMDGIASSSVATYLVQQQLHRPVFCLCNDFYVPSLRPLRQRCSHVYYLPPIRPQRLLARLEEIARREHVTALDQMALSELITMSGGDVRSCLNTMQFISSVVSQQQQQQQRQSDGGAAPPPRHTITELIRRMQGKDTRLALKESWQLLLTRPERNKAVQLLKQDYGVDYEGLVEAAASQHHRRHIMETRRRQERERAIGVGSRSTASTLPPQQQQVGQEVALGFRVDPGYIYAAQELARCPDTAGVVDGLQENYLDRAYTDYSFSRTCATAEGFSQQDITMTAAFQHPEMMMGTAERLNQVAALTCYVHCSTAARGGRIEFPREQTTLRRLQSESQHIGQQFRSGCRPHVAAFLGGEEVTSTDLAPMLLRCLFDRALRLPAHAITSFSRLPLADQRLLQTSVARHVEYGLNYEKDRHYTPSSGGSGQFGSWLASSNDDVPWRLTPELDRLLAGVVRPMQKTLLGGYIGSGGGGDSSHFKRSRYGDRSGTGVGAYPSSVLSKNTGGRGGTAYSSERLSLSSVMMPLKNEIRQILVGEIRQYQILQSAEFLKKQQKQREQEGGEGPGGTEGEQKPKELGEGAPGAASTVAAAAAASTAVHDKRPREDSSSHRGVAGGTAAADAVSGATNTSATPSGELRPIVTMEVSDGGVPEGKRVKVEEAKEGGRPAARRDFFGRPIPDPPAAATRAGRTSNSATPGSRPPSASPTASPSSTEGGGGFPRSQPPHVPSTQACVRYVYQDGSTNAVKMPAVLADF
jgi:chromosome transmission fidelity protein 18